MSADHKRPLLAFVLVGVMCALIIVGDIRSEAVSRLLHPIGQPIAAGVDLVRDRTWAEHSAPAPEAAPAVDPGGANAPSSPVKAPGTRSVTHTRAGSHQDTAGPGHVAYAGPATAQGHHPAPGQATQPPEQESPAQDGTSGNQGNHPATAHVHGAPGLVQHAADAVGTAVQTLSSGLLPGQGLHLGQTVVGNQSADTADQHALGHGHGPWAVRATGRGHGHHRAAERHPTAGHGQARGHDRAGRHHGWRHHGWRHGR